jgi:lysophospholipase L1-like esterase
MSRSALALLLVLFVTNARADDAVSPGLISSLDKLEFAPPKEKGSVALVEGHSGQAVEFRFDEGSRGAFALGKIRGTPEWDKAAGFSFLVKGDGSKNFGGLEFIYNDDFSVRYDYLFPLEGTDWRRITVAWRDLIPVLPGPKSLPLDPAGENRPSKLSALWFGKWWYHRDYPAHSFAVDDLRLEPTISRPNGDEKPIGDKKPAGHPLARTAAKLKSGQPITIVTMGDSLTDFKHWANREIAWPNLLGDQLKAKFNAEVTIVNPAIGGTQLRQNLVLMPRWTAEHPEPDLVTVCFGANDWDSGMRGPQFEQTVADAIDRIRRATRGKADVLVLTSIPGVEAWDTRAELAEACRRAAAARNAGLADTEKAFLAAGKTDRERLFVRDKVHLSPAGHEVVVEAVYQAILDAAK